MLATIGWTLAVVFGLLFSVIQWSWRKHAAESVAQSEFIAIMFIDPVVYENNRKVFIDWLNQLPGNVEIGHVRAVSQGAQNTATSYIGKLGIVSGLFAVLKNYKSHAAPRAIS